MKASEVIQALRKHANPYDVEGQRSFGIISRGEQLGVKTPVLKELAKRARGNHALALELWDSGVYEARQVAVFMDNPAQVTREQMEGWALDFDNWAITDGCCIHLFRKTPQALDCAREWARREEEFVKRAGYTLIASLAVHAKKEPDAVFLDLLPLVHEGAADERNYVIKAVNWALRQIGKRNEALREAAIAEAESILELDTKQARWAAKDALRELRGR